MDNIKLFDENQLLVVIETIDEYIAEHLSGPDCYNKGYVDACEDCVSLIRNVLNEPATSATHTLAEKEFQDYCAYKLIEKDIKGCMDRERTLETELERYRNKYGEL